MTRPLQALLLSDGRPGHFNLAEGILAAIARLRPVETRRLEVRRGRWPGAILATWSNSGSAPDRLLSTVYGIAREHLPAADLVVSAGAETLAANVACARVLAAGNIFYGSLRRFSPASFDLVLTSYATQAARPHHAFALKPSPAAIEARAARHGAPRRPPQRIALLIGGPSGESSYAASDWDGLADLIAAAAARGIRWQVTNSRRTPDTFSDRLARLLGQGSGGIEVLADVRRPPAPALAQILATCDAAVVTDDSSSMVSDAVAAGLPVIGATPRQHLPTANEQSYRDTLAAGRCYRALPISGLTADTVLAALADLQPLPDDPAASLTRLLAERMPGLLPDADRASAHNAGC